MPLLIAFIAVPILEIALFLQVGGLIGFWPTIAIVILTAIAGTYLVRSQGRATLDRLRGTFKTMRDPSEPLADGAMILVAGALLLTPGFFTDTVGIALLTPGVRRRVFAWLKQRIVVVGPRATGHDPFDRRADVIDGDYTPVEPDPPHREPRGKDGLSGWTRH